MGFITIEENKVTQRLAVLEYLKTHKGITSMDAIQLFGATRLSAIIFDLKKQGHNIVTIRREGTNRFGEPTRFAEYRLIQ